MLEGFECDITKNRAVVANSLITASYRMTVAEKRILTCVIAQIEKDEAITSDRVYIVSNSNYAKLANISRKTAWSEIAAIMDSMSTRQVRIFKSTGNRKKGLIINFFQSIYYDESSGIGIRFSDAILPYISELKREFTIIPINDIISFRSFHTMRLYEMIMQYKNVRVAKLTVLNIKTALDIVDKYKNGADFERYVIKPAIEEITKKTPVTYVKEKKGRAVYAYIFTIGESLNTKIEKKADFGRKQGELQFNTFQQESKRKPNKPTAQFIEFAAQDDAFRGKSLDECYKSEKMLRLWAECKNWLAYV